MGIDDNLSAVYNKLASDRKQRTLFDRYPGCYRAIVVEINDPLNMHRIRFKMPEMHDFDIQAKDCPWAVSAFSHGGKGAGNWYSPAIGDIVWITFEKQHPYGPIWIGHAEPTRRRFYKLHAIFQNTQVYVDEEGKPIGIDRIDWSDYLSKDGRPYSLGTKDRYGNMLVLDETGFFPDEHKARPTTAGADALSSGSFTENSNTPESNKPDRKMISMVSKYGHYFILGDQGYDWQSEFTGDFERDYNSEKVREGNLIKTLNESVPNSEDRDQRRVELRSSYGHKLELRDVGWSQAGPKNSLSRSNDLFGASSQQSNFSAKDERWLKLRTKGGHIIQMMDMGSDPANDVFIRRNRVDEVGGKTDSEDDNWQNRDARQLRMVTRYGFKMVLDDRGSDASDAEGKEVPRANGFLLKGRRDNSGFGFEFNEKDQLNHLAMYSPKSKIVEINDRFDYMMLCTDTNQSISKPWLKLKENEFVTAIAMTFNPQDDTYHLKLDKANEFMRLKTPQKGGKKGLNQGLEIRNEGSQNAKVWTELVDRDNRALILNSTDEHTAWHDTEEEKFILMDDKQNLMLLRNKKGKLQVFCFDNIEFKSMKNIVFEAEEGISFASKGAPFVVNAFNSSNFSVDQDGFGGNMTMSAPLSRAVHLGCFPGVAGGAPSSKFNKATPYVRSNEPDLTPEDRGKTYNGPYTEVSEEIIIQ